MALAESQKEIKLVRFSPKRWSRIIEQIAVWARNEPFVSDGSGNRYVLTCAFSQRWH